MEVTERVALTREAVTILMDAPARKAKFIVQVIYVGRFGDRFDLVVSDGFTWLKGRLKPTKKCEDTAMLSNYDVVSVLGKDFEKSQDSGSFVLKNLKIVTSKVKHQIGKPVHLPDYYHKKEFIDIDSGNQFEIDRFITVKEAKKMRVKKIKGSVLAKIVQIPSSCEKVMNILIEDEEDSIQCCFFHPEAANYHSTLVVGKWYLFDSPILQFNPHNSELELKIKGQSTIRLTTKSTPTPYNTQTPAPNSTKRQPSRSKSFSQKERPMTQFTPSNSYFKQDLVFIIARPLCEYMLRDGLGRYYDCVDRNGQTMEIILWSECNSAIELNKTYRFDGLRVKSTQGQKITLQSHREKTVIGPSHITIMSSNEMLQCTSKDKSIVKSRKEHKIQQPRQSTQQYSLTNLFEYVERCDESDNDILFSIVYAYLSTQLSAQIRQCSQFSPEQFLEIKKKIFHSYCKTCPQSGSKADGGLIMVDDAMVCFYCRSDKIGVIWNIKGVLKDSHHYAQCQINSDVVEKLLNLTPMEGLLMFFRTPKILIGIIQKQISFRRGIFKVCGKLKQGGSKQQNKGKSNENGKDKDQEKGKEIDSKKEATRLFNICEYQAYNSRVINQHIMKELRKVEAVYKEQMKRFVQQDNKTDTSNWQTDTESYDYEDDS